MQTKKKWTVWGTAAIIAIVIGTAGVLTSANADTSATTPGAVEDPLVTKSYVDAAVAKLVKEQLERLGPATDATGGTGGSESSKLEVVTVPLGSKLIVTDGAEIIVRTGKAIAYSSDANGLSDLTDGLDVKPGKPILNNHLILNPRGNRGVEADPKQTKGLIVLVRGAFSLQ